MTANANKRLIIVSNRLPIVITEEEGEWQISPGSGGLVTALAPVVKRHSGLWIGWPGCGEEAPIDELLDRFGREQGFQLRPIPLSEDVIEAYYSGFSNSTLWPLFHDLLGHCVFDQNTWETYREVNHLFGEKIATAAAPEDFIWVQDYQLLLAGEALRSIKTAQTLAFFLHIPFPSLDLFRRLPWKIEIIRALMAYDLIGFQTMRDRRNFVNAANALIPEVEVVTRQRHYTLMRYGQRTVKVGHFPISIDFGDFSEKAGTHEVADAAWYLHENLGGRQLILGVDRLDYTKGIPERFLAFERALEKYPELQETVSLVQVVVPSRTLVPDYQDLKEMLDQMAGRINSRFAVPSWTPIHYVYRSLEKLQLLAYYRTSEIALITPLRDGMNLVAKEYCACSIEEKGVLILSEFAGAADQMARGALMVNPYDIEGTADAIHQAFTMSGEERQRRMKLLRDDVRRNDVHHWVRRFIATMYGARL